MIYLEWRKRTTMAKGEGYGTGHKNEPEIDPSETPPQYCTINIYL